MTTVMSYLAKLPALSHCNLLLFCQSESHKINSGHPHVKFSIAKQSALRLRTLNPRNDPYIGCKVHGHEFLICTVNKIVFSDVALCAQVISLILHII